MKDLLGMEMKITLKGLFRNGHRRRCYEVSHEK